MYRVYIYLLLVVAFSNCNQSEGKLQVQFSGNLPALKIPLDTVDIRLVDYDTKTSLWSSINQPFSGFVTTRYPDQTLKSIFGVLEGKKQNTAKEYFQDGHLKSITNYYNGRIHGEKKSWSIAIPHILISSLNYISGKPHGTQKQWYPTGELFKVMNLDMGKEAGMQRAYRKNGDLFANYEAVNGRIFGLKKTALCYGIEDENIQYEN